MDNLLHISMEPVPDPQAQEMMGYLLIILGAGLLCILLGYLDYRLKRRPLLKDLERHLKQTERRK